MYKILTPVLLFVAVTIPLLMSFSGHDRTGNPSPDDYPKDYFISPVKGPIHLTGTCGELRSNHFHSGADIDGVVGDPVYAAADGYVYRIKVLESGYGNVLYVKHPNGYSTVYAHLDRFSAEIQKYVKSNQYRKERFQVELRPPASMFRVKKGQEIAKLGNSGSSSGSHLHFEIRNAASRALNPLLFGLPVVDNIAPELRDMKVYYLAEDRQVLGSKAFPLHKDKKGNIGLENDTINIGAWRVGFGVKTYDKSNGYPNSNGVYSIKLWANESLAYEWTADVFNFAETRYLNAHIDYSAKQRYGAWFHRCFVLPGNKLSNYGETPGLGSIQLYKEVPVKIHLEIKDGTGNTKSLTFWVKRDDADMDSFTSQPYQAFFPYDEDSHFEHDGFAITMEKGSLYESLGFQYSSSLDESSGIYSLMHHVHNTRVPVQKNFELRIRPDNLPAELRDKAFIAYCGEGKPDNCGGTWDGDMLKTRVRSFGDYCIMADTVAPYIKPVVFGSDMRKNKTMAFTIYDNFSISGTARKLNYRGTVDGQWVLFEYDRKRNRLTYTFDEHVTSGTHMLRLNVTDDKGNERVFEEKFVR